MDENSNNPQDKKKKKGSRMVASLIIGGAIGSILGLTLAPKKTRQALKEKGGKVFRIGKAIIKTVIKKKSD